MEILRQTKNFIKEAFCFVWSEICCCNILLINAPEGLDLIQIPPIGCDYCWTWFLTKEGKIKENICVSGEQD